MLVHVAALRLALVLCAVGPTGAEAIVDFEAEAVGTVFGDTAGDSPGDPVLTQDGIRMSVETFFLNQVLTDFFEAQVVSADLGGETSNALLLNSIGVMFDLSGVGFPVDQVTLDFADTGGTTNFAVNGAGIHILDPLAALPANVAPGVTAMVDGGRITLTGVGADILELRIGGQELLIDNIAVVPEPAAGLLASVALLAMLGRRRRPAQKITAEARAVRGPSSSRHGPRCGRGNVRTGRKGAPIHKTHLRPD